MQGVVTDGGDCTRGERRAQGVFAYFLRGEIGETGNGLGTWELCRKIIFVGRKEIRKGAQVEFPKKAFRKGA